jgi:hypothetical protein
MPRVVQVDVDARRGIRLGGSTPCSPPAISLSTPPSHFDPPLTVFPSFPTCFDPQYSRWDVVPVGEVPAKCASCLCDCGGSQKDWLPPPDPKEFKTKVQSDEEESCCTWKVPMGRTLDTFDADIIVDASAHQTLCQICRGEGDVVLYRKAGADLSDPSEVFVMSDVVDPFNVFNETTFELSKINLQGATASALGMRMGATVWNYDARSGADGSAQKKWRGDQETIFYDSLSARRTCLGYCCNLPLCCPPIYKITSERVLYTEWDYWYPCDNPGDTCLCGPIYCLRGCARECCCAVGSSAAAAERRQAAQDKKADEGGSEVPSCAGRCCRCPIGRTAHYFDIDIVADIRAHQSCWQVRRSRHSRRRTQTPHTPSPAALAPRSRLAIVAPHPIPTHRSSASTRARSTSVGCRALTPLTTRGRVPS